MSNLRARPNIVAIRVSDADNQVIASCREHSSLAPRLSYFELVQLHRAAPILFSQRLYNRENLTAQQIEEWKAYSRIGTSLKWPGRADFAPIPATKARNPFLPVVGPEPKPEDATAEGFEPGLDSQDSQPEAPAESEAELGDSGESDPRVISTAPETDVSDEPVVDEQQDFVAARVDENQLVYAPPGTGKTHGLIERLVRLAESRSREIAGRFLVLSFSRATVRDLKKRLGSKVTEEGVSVGEYIEVRTFDSFASYLLSFDIHWSRFKNKPDSFKERLEDFIKRLREGELPEAARELAKFSHLFIDEVQDLTAGHATLVLELAERVLSSGGSVTALGDRGQAIYDFKAKEIGDMNSDQFLARFESLFPGKQITRRRFTRFWRYKDIKLKNFVSDAAMAIGSYGNSPDLPKFSNHLRSILLVPPVKIAQLLDQYEYLTILVRRNAQAIVLKEFCSENMMPSKIHRGRDQPWPGWYGLIFSGWQMNRMTTDRLLERIHERCPNKSVGLIRQTLQEERCMNSQGVVDVEYLGNQILNNPAPGDSDASLGHSPVIRISTIHKAKGLEFDHVLVLEPDYQRLIGSVEESKIMYVGITRGVHSVKLLENRRFKGIRSTKGGQWHSRSGDGKGLFVDGLEEIDIATVLELPGGSFLGEEQFKLRQTALRDYAGARRIGLHIPAGADRHWLFADDGMGVSTPICAVSKNLDRDIKKLPGHHRQREYQADIEGMVTVAFNREDSTARALLGPARVVNVPLLSGSLVCLVPNPQEGR